MRNKTPLDPSVAVRPCQRCTDEGRAGLLRWKLGAIVDAAMAVVVEGEVQPLLVGADKTIGIVHAAFRTVARLGL